MSSPDVVYVGIGDDSLVPELIDSAHESSSSDKLIDTLIAYPHPVTHGTTVYLQSSNDKFETFVEMSPTDPSDPSKVSLRLHLPLGTLLYRFYVERQTGGGEEFVTDESVEVVCVDGNDYNVLNIEEEEEEEEDDDGASVKSTSSSSSSSSTSPSPPHSSAEGQSGGHRRQRSQGTSLAAAMGVAAAGAVLEKKKKKKKKHKKKHGGGGGADGPSASHPSGSSVSSASLDRLKADMLRRESEWRDAWLMSEMRASQEAKAKEEQMKASFNAERSKWLKYIKEMKNSEEENKKEILSLRDRIEELAAMKELEGKQKQTQSLGWAEQQKVMLEAQSTWQKKSDELSNEIASLKNELSSLSKTRDEEKSTLLKAVQTLKISNTSMTTELTTAKGEFSTLKSKYSEIQNVLLKTKSDFNKEKNFLKKRTMDPAEFKETMDMVSGGLRNEVNEWKSKAEEWEKKYSEVKTANMKLEEKMKDEVATAAAAAASTASTASAADVDQLKNTIVELKMEVETKDRKISTIIDENKRNEEIAKKQFTIQQKVLNDQLNVLQTENDDKDKLYNGALTELNTKKNENIELEGKMKGLEDKVKEMERKWTDSHSEVEEKGKAFATAKKEWEDKEKLWATERERLEGDSKEKEKKVLETNSKVIDLQREVQETKMEIEKGEMKLKLRESSWQREKAEIERKIQQFSNMKNEIGVRINEINKFKSSLESSLSTVRKEVTSLSSSYITEFNTSRVSILASVSSQSNELNETVKKYKKECSQRRKYFNMVQELKGNIRVFCRVRPPIEEDKKKGAVTCITYPPSEVDAQSMILATVLNGKEKKNPFEFDRVFQMQSTQDEVFAETRDLVQSTMDGYNVCIFAYGQTGSGKSFTMSGIEGNRGVNYRALNELFRIRDERKDDYDYTITVSMKEIYNEAIRDLLDPIDKGELKIRQTTTGSMYVENLKDLPVQNEDDVLRLMSEGNKNRATGSTNMNELSSRSHSLLSVNVVGVHRSAGISYFGKLHLIDLAGSERLARTEATGDRLKEAQAINKSLAALGNVIEALQKKQQHIPYRNSKLTYLLQDSLGGHAKTLMFINVSPNDSDADETLCSLNFATRVRQVELGTASRSVVHSTDDSAGGAADDSAASAEGDAPSDEVKAPAEKAPAAAAAAPAAGAVKKVAGTKVGASAAASVVKKVAAPAKAAAATPAKAPVKPALSTPASGAAVARKGSTAGIKK